MQNSRTTKLATIFFSLLILVPSAALCDSNAIQAKKSLSAIKVEIRKLKKLAKKTGGRANLFSAAKGIKEFSDSDSDGLPDILENIESTDSCVADSDSDGISDGNEERAGSNPDSSQQSEIELTDTVTAITTDTVSVGGYTFTVTAETKFKKVSSLDAISVGDRVEVSGKKSGSGFSLSKLSLED